MDGYNQNKTIKLIIILLHLESVLQAVFVLACCTLFQSPEDEKTVFDHKTFYEQHAGLSNGKIWPQSTSLPWFWHIYKIDDPLTQGCGAEWDETINPLRTVPTN